MTSVSKDAKGHRIRFYDHDGTRRTLRLTRLNRAKAEAVGRHIEELVSSKTSGQPVGRQTSLWLSEIGDSLWQKLARTGLVEERNSTTLGRFIESYIAGRTVKTATSTKWTTAKNHLLGFFPVDTPLRSITEGQADQFREYLYSKGQKENTVRRLCGIAKQFFRAAERSKLLDSNPFADQVSTVQPNDSAYFFVTPEATAKLVDAAPDWQWKAIIALVRYGGLRCPSEVLELKWDDIDWLDLRFEVRSSKTEHHEGGGIRIVPLFPELHEILREGQEVADSGTIHVITRYRDPTQNLRTTFSKIVKRAKVEPLVKPFQNMRSSRETELVERFPIHVVVKWLGNSEAVARKHYLQTTDEHYARAVQTPQVPRCEKVAPYVAPQTAEAAGISENTN